MQLSDIRIIWNRSLNFVPNIYRLLKGAEEIFLKKRLKQEHGGQLRDFFMEDAVMYENIDCSAEFFTTQERQQITLHLLNNIRITHTQKVDGYVMVEGQAIGKLPAIAGAFVFKLKFWWPKTITTDNNQNGIVLDLKLLLWYGQGYYRSWNLNDLLFDFSTSDGYN